MSKKIIEFIASSRSVTMKDLADKLQVPLPSLLKYVKSQDKKYKGFIGGIHRTDCPPTELYQPDRLSRLPSLRVAYHFLGKDTFLPSILKVAPELLDYYVSIFTSPKLSPLTRPKLSIRYADFLLMFAEVMASSPNMRVAYPDAASNLYEAYPTYIKDIVGNGVTEDVTSTLQFVGIVPIVPFLSLPSVDGKVSSFCLHIRGSGLTPYVARRIYEQLGFMERHEGMWSLTEKGITEGFFSEEAPLQVEDGVEIYSSDLIDGSLYHKALSGITMHRNMFPLLRLCEESGDLEFHPTDSTLFRFSPKLLKIFEDAKSTSPISC